MNNTIYTKCISCSSGDIEHEEKIGRGFPPKNRIDKRSDNRKISWVGIWHVWTCENCKETWRELSK